MAPIAIIDACVLYPAPLRDLMMWLAMKGAFSARWSEQILSEWVESLLNDRPDLDRNRLEGTCREMNRAIPDAMTAVGTAQIELISLPDPDNRHVVAAAVTSKARWIITRNIKDFPFQQLPSGIVAITPDAFLCQLIESIPTLVIETMKAHRESLLNPPKTAPEYFETLLRNGLVEDVVLAKPIIANI